MHVINPQPINPSQLDKKQREALKSDKVDVVIDGGDGGLVPSTIVDCTENIPEIIREGKGVLK